MNNFRYLHSIINDNTTCLKWRKAQLNFETKLKEYNLDKEAKVLSRIIPVYYLLIISLLSINT